MRILPQARLRLEDWFVLVCVILCTIVAAWIRYPIFSSFLPSGWDVPYHIEIARKMISIGSVPIWVDEYSGGTPYEYPFLSHLILAVAGLANGMHLVDAYRGVMWIVTVATVPVSYVCTKILSKNRYVALASIFFLAVSYSNIGIAANFYPNALGLFLLLVELATFARAIDENRFSLLMVASGIFGMLMLTHTISSSVAIMAMLLYTVIPALKIPYWLRDSEQIRNETSRIRLVERVGKLLIVLVLGGSIGAEFWLPVLVKRLILKTGAGAAYYSINRDYALVDTPSLADLHYELGTAPLVLFGVGSIIALKRARSERIPVVFLVSSLVLLYLTQGAHFGFYMGFPNRYVVFLALFLYMVASYALVCLIRKLAATRFSWQMKTVVGALLIFTIVSISTVQGMAVTKQFHWYTIYSSDVEAMSWISANTPERAVFVTDHFRGSWIPALTGRKTLSTAFALAMVLDTLMDRREIFSTTNSSHALLLMQKYGANYIYWNAKYPEPENLADPKGLAKFEDPKFFARLYEKNGVLIYKTLTNYDIASAEPRAEVNAAYVSSGTITVKVKGQTRVQVRVPAYPGWHVYHMRDGARTEIELLKADFVTFTSATGENRYVIKYEPTADVQAGFVVSLVSLFMTLILSVKYRDRSRQHDEALV